MGNQIPQMQPQNQLPNQNNNNHAMTQYKIQELPSLLIIDMKVKSLDMLIYLIDPYMEYQEQYRPIRQRFQQNHSQSLRIWYDIESLLKHLQTYNGGRTIRVIASAALPDKVYEKLNKNRFINRILLFCQNRQKAIQIWQKNFKVIQCGKVVRQVSQMIVSQRDQSYRHSVLFTLDQDLHVAKLLWTNYFCFLRLTNKQQAKQDLITLATHMFPNKINQIIQFENQYKVDLNAQQYKNQVKQWIWKDSFYWELAQNFSKLTVNPQRLAYVRLLYKDIYETILSDYTSEPQTQGKFYIVTKLSHEQLVKLRQNKPNLLMFVSFIKGFSKLLQAHNYLQAQANQQKYHLFAISKTGRIFKTQHQIFQYGYIMRKDNKYPDVVFNIFNIFSMFSVEQLKTSLNYGGLCEPMKVYNGVFGRPNLNGFKRKIIKFYLHMMHLKGKIVDQNHVLLQSKFFLQSSIFLNRRMEQIEQNHAPLIQIDRTRLRMGDSLRQFGKSLPITINQQRYQQANMYYSQITSPAIELISDLRKVEILILQQNIQGARNRLRDILDEFNNFESLNNLQNRQQYYRGRYLQILVLRKQGQVAQALRKYIELKNEMINNIPGYKNIECFDDIIEQRQECCKLLNQQIQLMNEFQ